MRCCLPLRSGADFSSNRPGIGYSRRYRIERRHCTKYLINPPRTRAVGAIAPTDNFLLRRLNRADSAEKARRTRGTSRRAKLRDIEDPR